MPSNRGKLAALAAVFGLFAMGPAHAFAASRIPASFPAAGELTVDSLVARAAPRKDAHKVLVLRQFRKDFRRQVVLALKSRKGADGKPWLQLNLPMRPNGTLGWVPAAALDVHPTKARIVISRAARKLSLYQGSRLRYRTTVAVGRPGMETPVGNFYVTARFVPDNSFLGVFAFETSAYSRLTDWPGGGVVGIHGTSLPQLLGQAVSHGCVRMSNQAASFLRRYVPVGTPIKIVG
jgi:lipoprotein-anchoring transpeptidase ErfK/SrfK